MAEVGGPVETVGWRTSYSSNQCSSNLSIIAGQAVNTRHTLQGAEDPTEEPGSKSPTQRLPGGHGSNPTCVPTLWPQLQPCRFGAPQGPLRFTGSSPPAGAWGRFPLAGLFRSLRQYVLGYFIVFTFYLGILSDLHNKSC